MLFCSTCWPPENMHCMYHHNKAEVKCQIKKLSKQISIWVSAFFRKLSRNISYLRFKKFDFLHFWESSWNVNKVLTFYYKNCVWTLCVCCIMWSHLFCMKLMRIKDNNIQTNFYMPAYDLLLLLIRKNTAKVSSLFDLVVFFQRKLLIFS